MISSTAVDTAAGNPLPCVLYGAGAHLDAHVVEKNSVIY
jgi:hypothetical protein